MVILTCFDTISPWDNNCRQFIDFPLLAVNKDFFQNINKLFKKNMVISSRAEKNESN